jgi:V/A-type H+/Na+-transporting ATPase subunit K
MKFKLAVVVMTLGVVLTCGAFVAAMGSSAPEGAAKAEGVTAPGGGMSKSAAGALAAGLVGGLSILGAGIAVGRVGSAGVGAFAEKPELFVRALIFVAIAEGLAIIGFALAYMLSTL